MLAVFLLIPFLLIRFPLLSHFGKNALSRTAYFAPVQGKEKIAYMIYQTAAHWIILSEERWCLEKFGKSYQDYQDKVRRYF